MNTYRLNNLGCGQLGIRDGDDNTVTVDEVRSVLRDVFDSSDLVEEFGGRLYLVRDGERQEIAEVLA